MKKVLALVMALGLVSVFAADIVKADAKAVKTEVKADAKAAKTDAKK